MAGNHRQSSADLRETLLAEGPGFEFFQAVALAQRLFPEAAPIGRQGPPAAEKVRLRPRLSLGFDTSDVHAVSEQEASDESVRLLFETTFLGLYGSASPLPDFYTEDLIDELEDGRYDPVREFLDLFHHRLLSLFFRVGFKYRFDLEYATDEAEMLAKRLPQLVGHQAVQLPSPTRRATLAASLLMSNGSAASVEALLSEAFPQVEIKVEACVARWMIIPRPERNRLGSSRLGYNYTLGTRIRDRACTFAIHLGPLEAATFEEFLPGGKKLRHLLELVKQVNPNGLDVILAVRVQPEAVPAVELGRGNARLGWSSWIGERPSQAVEVRFFYAGGDLAA